MTSITIDKKFNGPPNSGNGGYVAGVIAANLPFLPEITLRAPPPLDQAMNLRINENTAKLLDGDTLVAEAKVADFQLTILPPVSFARAKQASVSDNAYEASPFQDCFVCGAHRAEGDGLKIRSKNIGHQKVAAPWIPYPSLGDENQEVKTEFIWAALDCPGAWAIQDAEQFYLLGRMATKIVQPIIVGEKYVIMGWVIASEGRKTWTGTAIYDEEGKVCAYAKGTWISVKQ
ncbi:MAG: hypothetical protein AB8G86_02035 [Saprospiraceae bacterium]